MELRSTGDREVSCPCFEGERALRLLAGLATLAVAAAVLRAADDPTRMIRDGFETPATVWEQEQTDAVINLFAHDRTQRAAHDGRLSEHFQFAAGPGSSFFYSYRLPKVPATNDLRVSLFVRANRAGVRIYGRVILPTDTDPDTGQPSFVLVPGTIYDNVDRWQRIELAGLPPSIESQARVIRASTKRPVKLEGAYLDRIVVNLYCGAGQTEVFLDELSVAPVPAEVVAAPDTPGRSGRGGSGARRSVTRPAQRARGRGRARAEPAEAERRRLVRHGHRGAGGRRRRAPQGGVRRPGREHQRRSRAVPRGGRRRVPAPAQPGQPRRRAARAGAGAGGRRRRSRSATRSPSGAWATSSAASTTSRRARRSSSGSARSSRGSAAFPATSRT